MPFAILQQIIARTFLWTILISMDIVGPLIFLLKPQGVWIYGALLILAVFALIYIWQMKKDALLTDMREILLYDVLANCVAVGLSVSGNPAMKFHIALTGALATMKYLRLIWPCKATDGEHFANWPVFGLLGWLEQRKNSVLALHAAPTPKQARMAYLSMAACLMLGIAIAAASFELKLAYFCVIPLMAAPALYKRIHAEIHTQHALYLVAQQQKLEAEKAAARAEAKAETESILAQEREAANRLLAAKNEELAATNTELAQAHAAIEQLLAEQEKDKAEVDHLNRALMHAAHDLAQPLARLGIAVTRLFRTKDDAEREEIQKDLQKLSLNLANECRATIYGAKVATGSALPQVKSFSINALLRELWLDWRDDAIQHGMEAFLLWPTGNPPLNVAGDKLLITRVIRNLILNAITHSEKGSLILISVRKRKTHALVQVWNTGNGIPGYDTPDGEANFAHFAAQMLEEGKRRGDSHGLGIDNVKHLSRSLGLRISLRSRVGHGTVFGFVLPLADYRLMAYT